MMPSFSLRLKCPVTRLNCNRHWLGDRRQEWQPMLGRVVENGEVVIRGTAHVQKAAMAVGARKDAEPLV